MTGTQNDFDVAVMELALNTEFYCHDLNRVVTIREYLKELLMTLWREKEGFSGKRPFGNSSWEYDLYKPLIEKGFIVGRIGSDGYIETVNHKNADSCIRQLIEHLFRGK